MKKILFLVLIMLVLLPVSVYAQRGCCSQHSGVCGCNKYGTQVCCDGTLSKTCRCTPPTVYGCTDRNANNYNADANTDDGSCTYTIKGCTDPNANNYNSNANTDDGSCEYEATEQHNVPDTKTDNTSDSSNGILETLGTLTALGAGGTIAYLKAKKKN